MKIVSLINQHVAIWSFLRGDHALKHEINLIAPKLLNNPNFIDPLENKLRLEVFKHKRNWIYEYMHENASFAIIQYSANELEKFTTCFSEVNMKKYVNEHVKAYEDQRDFLIKRSKVKSDLKKSFVDVEKEYNIKQKMKELSSKASMKDVLDSKQGNEDNLFLATNRCWIMKQNEKNVIVDGNHRLTAYYWAKKIDKCKTLPNKLYGFYFIMNRQ